MHCRMHRTSQIKFPVTLVEYQIAHADSWSFSLYYAWCRISVCGPPRAAQQIGSLPTCSPRPTSFSATRYYVQRTRIRKVPLQIHTALAV
jgi:hypothetical protein